MLTPEQEFEQRDKSNRGICHVNGCGNHGKNRVQVTFVTIHRDENGNTRQVQARIPAWECGDHR